MAERTDTTHTAPKPHTSASTPDMPRPSHLEETSHGKSAETGGHVQERVQEIGTQVRDWAEGVGSDIKSGAQDAMQQMGDSAAHLSEQGQAALGQLEKTLESSIREKPLSSLLIAAGVGVMIGLLMRK